MSIQEIFLNIKQFPQWGDLTVGFLFVVVAAGSFFLGRVSVGEPLVVPVDQYAEGVSAATPLTPPGETHETGQNLTIEAAEITQEEGVYVGSKNGTKYHLPWCSGAKRIKEENKVWFGTKEEAERAGYAPAANCEGI